MSAFAGPLRVVRFDDVLHFRSRAMPVLLPREAENNLLLGTLSRVPANRLDFREANVLLCTVESTFGSVLAARPAPAGLRHRLFGLLRYAARRVDRCDELRLQRLDGFVRRRFDIVHRRIHGDLGDFLFPGPLRKMA